MNKHESYSGIDYFRFIAALLIIAVHTSPLASFSQTGDFILTRVIARVAVPFFFITSGYFLITKYACNAKKLANFVKKSSLIYALSILIYIPINIYNNYFQMDNLLPNLVKDIIFDGTLYHLWYLPASIIGAAIAWYLVKNLSYKKAFIITAALYIIGMLGDSYYGITQSIPGLSNLYKLIFQVTDFTRNGIFFAPIFFVLGGYISQNKNKPSIKKSTLGLAISFAIMLTEALLLHHFDLQKHDSMYIFLLPTMYFLFHILTNIKGNRIKNLRTISLVIYIMHPFVIVAIRLFAKITKTEKLFIENSIIHFVAVCAATVVFSIIWIFIWNKIKKNPTPKTQDTDRAYLEIDLNNLEHNVNILQKAMPQNCKLMAIAKAECYGHGMFETTTFLEKIGVSSFAVATIDEGINLRKYGISSEILILGHTSPSRAKEIYKYKLTQTIIDYNYCLCLNEQGYKINAHIKIDTGMHRLGFDYKNTKEITDAFQMKNINVTGIFTHLCCSDSQKADDIEFTQSQTENFRKLLDNIKSNGIKIPKIHMQSSYGLLNYPDIECDYARIGVALYGVLSSANDKTKLNLDLKPVLALKAKVVLLRNISEGESVGYGRKFVAKRDSKIAMLPIGYADGWPRALSFGNNYVLINSQKAPIVGLICMDQMAIDVTDIPDVKIGSIATLIGKDGNEELTAPVVADNSESITNELLSRMGHRLNIIYK